MGYIRFFLCKSAFNMTFMNSKCVYYICKFFLNYFIPNKSSDKIKAYAMLNRHIKMIKVKLKTVTRIQ